MRNSIIVLSWIAIIGIVGCARTDESSGVVQFSIDADNLHGGAALRDLRFYVHDVALIATDGEVVPFIFFPESDWQQQRVGLIDLVGDSGADRSAALYGRFHAPGKQISGIRFAVGVPFELNHANPLTASAPLNRPDLFWVWQSGYKFLRADLADARGEWSFHLGSTGCASASAVRPPEAACRQPNVMHIELSGFDPLSESIKIRVDELAKSMRVPGSGVCTGGYATDPVCADIFSKTGLNPRTGVCSSRRCEQRLFVAAKGSDPNAS